MTSTNAHSQRHDTALACVLAGGQSRRMGGGDKTLIDLDGKPMLARIIDRLAPQTDNIILNANGDPARFAEFGYPVVADPVGDYAGPLAGILAGLTYARDHMPGTDYVVSVAGDTPFFPKDLISRLLASVPAGKPVIALASSHDKLHPVFGLWPVALAGDLHEWLSSGQTGKVLAFVDRHDSIEVPFADDAALGLDPFFNANRPEDIDKARRAMDLI